MESPNLSRRNRRPLPGSDGTDSIPQELKAAEGEHNCSISETREITDSQASHPAGCLRGAEPFGTFCSANGHLRPRFLV